MISAANGSPRDFSFRVGIPSTSQVTRARKWSCRFLPTPGSAWCTAMPARARWSGSPTPDNCKSCGEPIAPPARTIALPPAAAAGLLHPADAARRPRRQMVDVVAVFEPDLLPGLDHRLAEERLVSGARGQQRAARAVKRIAAALPALAALEVGQNVVP